MEVKLMKIIGLTGGSGTGKGTVAARMRSLGRTTRALPASSSGTVCPMKPHAPASMRSRTTCFTAKNAILSSKTTAISICCIGTPMLYTVNSLSDSD